MFDFLGVQRVPGITTACFAADHEVRGPGDHKIWFTDSIRRDSLGQGSRVPIGAIPPELLAEVNQTLARLEYRQVDERWPVTTNPLASQADHECGAGESAMSAQPDAETYAAACALATQLRVAAAGAQADGVATWWPDAASGRLTFLVRPTQGDGPELGWTLSRDDSGLTIRAGAAPDPAGVVLMATGATWLAILTGQANMAVEQRAGRLHFTSPASGPLAGALPGMPAEFRLLTRLFGTTANTRPEMPTEATPADAAMAAR